MRRTVGVILIGLGAFFLTFAPLIRFYIGHRVLAAPTDMYQQVTLQATDASYLDQAKLKIRKGVTLTATLTTRGDVRAATGDVAVWDHFISIQDNSGTAVQVQAQRSAFNRHSAMLVNCCGAAVNGDTTVRQTGIGLYWPVDVRKKSYPYFDPSTLRAWPMNYTGEATVHGVRAYRFVQTVPPTKTGSVPDVPASLLGFKRRPAAGLPGLDKKTGTLTVDQYYRSTVTVWVDPRTGAPVNQEEAIDTTMRTRDGRDRLAVADLDLKMTDASQRALVARSNHKATTVSLATGVGPIGALVLGVIALVAGIVLVATGRRASRSGTGGPPANQPDEPARHAAE